MAGPLPQIYIADGCKYNCVRVNSIRIIYVRKQIVRQVRFRLTAKFNNVIVAQTGTKI